VSKNINASPLMLPQNWPIGPAPPKVWRGKWCPSQAST
jgi:hypothetical protein